MYYCYNCNKSNITKENYCSKCAYCYSCCCCNVPKFFNNKLKFHTPKRTQKKYNKSDRFIAAEIEVAGIKKNKKDVENIVRKWNGNIVEDQSLPQSGFEINTSPAAGDLYVKQVQEICKVLNDAGATIVNRCGLHVHLDARDFNFDDIRRLVMVYAAIEPALFSMVPESRHNIKYALRCADKYENAINGENLSHLQLKQKIVMGTYGRSDTRFRTNRRGAGHGTSRYYALNLHSWFYRGTIECRLFDGTVNSEEIIAIGTMWAIILDFVMRSGDNEILNTINKKMPYESLLAIVKDAPNVVGFVKIRYKKYGK